MQAITHMARPKKIKPTVPAYGRIPAMMHTYLVDKYGSISAALRYLWATDTMPAPAASQQAPAQAQAPAAEPQPQAPAAQPTISQAQPIIDQLLAELLAEAPGTQPPLY